MTPTDTTRPADGTAPDSGHTETHDAREGLRGLLAVRAERDALAASVARVRGLAELDNKSAWLPAGTKVKRVTNRRDGYESITSMVAVDDLRRALDGSES